MTVDIVSPSPCILGERPIWCERTGRLLWIDSRAPALHVYEPASGVERSHALPETIGSICFCEDGTLLAAMTTGIFRLAMDGVLGALVARPEPNHADNRFNDGRCDRRGRFWVGTLNDKARIPTGALWRLVSGPSLTHALADIVVPNSLAFSPDNRTMYMADTYRHRIFAFDYDIDDGAIGGKRVFSDMSGWTGRPDGSAIDADGCLWNAEYAGSRVVRYTPSGRIDRVIRLPVSQPTCCAFGGKDLDELYVTTARQRLTDPQLVAEPHAGNLLMVKPGVKGLPEGRFSG